MVAALDADPELAPIFAARSTWLPPQDGFSARRDEWPLVDDWARRRLHQLGLL